MRVLFVSDDDLAGELALCLQAKDHGWDTRWFFQKTERNKDVGNGLVDVVDDWRDWMRWADLVILAGNTRYMREMDAWRERGAKIIGATQESAAWELNRTLGQEVFEEHGIPVPDYTEFSSYDDAIAFVKREMRRFVSKPLGDEPDKSLSYCAKSPEDLVYMLERWKKAQKLKGAFLLQEFIPGIEMAVGGWIGPQGFLPGWCENFEFKKLMAGDCGTTVGESGTVLRYVKSSKLANKVLKPLEDAIVATGHTGYIDINCIIDKSGTPWPLEATSRFGWPTINIQTPLHKGDPIQWLADLADGQSSPPFMLETIALGCVVAIGDYPHSHLTKKEVVGIPIYGLTDKEMENVHYCSVMMGEAPQEKNRKIVKAPLPVTAGDYLLVATGTGDSVQQAQKAAYKTIKSLEIPSSPFWRNDIGNRLKKELPELQAQGFATGMLY